MFTRQSDNHSVKLKKRSHTEERTALYIAVAGAINDGVESTSINVTRNARPRYSLKEPMACLIPS